MKYTSSYSTFKESVTLNYCYTRTTLLHLLLTQVLLSKSMVLLASSVFLLNCLHPCELVLSLYCYLRSTSVDICLFCCNNVTCGEWEDRHIVQGKANIITTVTMLQISIQCQENFMNVLLHLFLPVLPLEYYINGSHKR